MTQRPEDDWYATAETAEHQPGAEALGLKLMRWWGMLFRALFISIIGIVGYLWLDPQSIGDVPLAELTLNQILKNVVAALIAIGCITWFFNFPENGADRTEANPYVAWGRAGGWFSLVALFVVYWLING